jgi:hypothetical protein
MAHTWFRFYHDAVNNPKVQRLPAQIFRFWVNALCLSAANDGWLPSIKDLQFSLRLSEAHLADFIGRLIDCELFDKEDQGIRPHNWDKRQFKSDCSTDRVKRFRNVSETANETPPDTEQIQIQNQNRKGAPRFDEFWLVCPRKIGKQAAEKAWGIAASGVDAEALIQAMRSFAGQSKDTPVKYLPAPARWLSEKRWQDESLGGSTPLDPETAADIMDRADRLMRRGKYAEKYQ